MSAPQLKLKTRLTQSADIDNSSTLASLGQNAERRFQARREQVQVKVEIPSDIPLSPQEEVIVKDVWNKLRAWKELQMERFLTRSLLEEPELEYIFGEAIDGMSDRFYELFDYCVHKLQPHSQNVVWEPLMGVPPEKGDIFDTVQDRGAVC